mgnify:CR=1 FL=1|tara:strand:+ start:914 stop:1234 length:321 start_codon:yes stop_codon:yes gene_type:complete
MAGTLDIGNEPLGLNVTLAAGTDFVSEVEYMVAGAVADWPVGTSLSLLFDDGNLATWAATITGAVARFDVDKADTAAIPKASRVRLQYTNGSTDRALAVGRVRRFD